MSRSPVGQAASSIRAPGVEVQAADLDDGTSLRAAFRGAHGVYGVTTMLSSTGKLDTRVEKRQGMNIADACVEGGVEHLMLSTIPSITDGVRVPYVRSELDIEDYVRDRQIPHTFLGPGSFMDEIGGEFLRIGKGTLTGQAADDVKIPTSPAKTSASSPGSPSRARTSSCVEN